MILNLGCGTNIMEDAVNVDAMPLEGVNEVVNLSKLPWRWKDESVDEIYMLHLLEHFDNPALILTECYRILEPSCVLHITVPHSSSVSGIGCLGHYRTFSYDTLNDYLCRDFYLFKKALFKTMFQRLIWIPHHTNNPIHWLIDL